MTELDKYLLNKAAVENRFGYGQPLPEKMDYSQISQQPSSGSDLASGLALANQLNQATGPSQQGGGQTAAGGALSGAGAGASTGFALGGPKGAAIGAGVGALTGILSAEAADKRARRLREAEIAQQLNQNQNQGFQTIYQALQGGFR